MRTASPTSSPDAMQEWRSLARRTTRAIAAVALAAELGASASLRFDLRSVVVATLATAVLASAAFYGAYEGFDERLRRKP